jgi:flagellar biosynthesis protein FlhA
MIALINIVGGIIIGVGQMGLGFGEAAQNYTVLTVGDGLVTQIPALIVSTAAGLMVSKAGTVGSTDKALFAQLGGYPKALGSSSFLMLALGLVPGIPMVPFLLLATVTGIGAIAMMRQHEMLAEKKQTDREDVAAKPVEESIATALAIDELRLELGYGLLPLINDTRGHRLTDQIKTLRRQIAGDMGFVMPSVRIIDNMHLPSNIYVIRIKEVEAGRGELHLNQLLVMDPRGERIALPGQDTVEPTFGLPAMWIDESMREEALFRGYTVVDPGTVVTTHLTELMKDNMSDLLSYAETQKLLDDLPKQHQKLVADLIPARIAVNGVQRVLQNLLSERVSVRDLPTILESVSEACGYTQNIAFITEHVRGRLARQLSHANLNGEGYVPLVTLSPTWEQRFTESLTGSGEDRQLTMPPSRLQEFIGEVRQIFDRLATEGHLPVLLTSPNIRPYVRSIIERFRPSTVVMSQNEIHPKVKLRTLAQV